MKQPAIGSQVAVTITDAPAIITKVHGWNPAYKAWIVRADWNGRDWQLMVVERNGEWITKSETFGVKAS